MKNGMNIYVFHYEVKMKEQLKNINTELNKNIYKLNKIIEKTMIIKVEIENEEIEYNKIIDEYNNLLNEYKKINNEFLLFPTEDFDVTISNLDEKYICLESICNKLNDIDKNKKNKKDILLYKKNKLDILETESKFFRNKNIELTKEYISTMENIYPCVNKFKYLFD